ncbi:MAG: rhomboid family intramembrane serine protease [Nanoarchaeota archaeon]
MSLQKRGVLSGVGVTASIIAINVIVFLVFSLVGVFFNVSGNPDFFARLSGFLVLNPLLFFDGYFWTVLTSMFMHVNFTHLLVNMISLLFLGSFVERLIGKRRYLVFYISAGIIAGLFYVFLAAVGSGVPSTEALFGNLAISAVGASGAIFGLGGLLAVLMPRMKVLVFFVIPMRLWMAMVVLMFGLWALSAAASLPVGNSAHFGGLLVGVVYGFYLRAKFPGKINMLNRMFGR